MELKRERPSIMVVERRKAALDGKRHFASSQMMPMTMREEKKNHDNHGDENATVRAQKGRMFLVVLYY